MKTTVIAATLLVCAMNINAHAQDTEGTPAKQDKLATATQVLIDNVAPIELQARVIEIDREARTLALEGKHGNIAVIAVRPDVKGFDDLKVGDTVKVAYKNAVLMTADKVKAGNDGIRERVETQTYAPGGTGYDATRKVEVVATVSRIDIKKRLVTLRGATRTQTLYANPAIDLTALKPGDTVHAVFQSATAVEIVPGQAVAQ
ncbi:hypothetical protein WT21_12010 [Burkholderia territorii]|uniref:hypothetical protein n=1 Tax=Burkholderia territorii TaxID=1503055 RepID=UPI000753AEC4|nr:hypothetical protein [Burkholderia territorii]KVL25564.1 hypothetical protein WS97_30170 [Burkholderia territorii]KVQ50247.1 hypothetical protein WT21_12010 [Burkholderia territorii]KVT77111.1 hypothetical protein WT25_23495 [Burkholderia territorii]